MADLGEAFGEDAARVGTLARAVGEGAEHDHHVAVIGHDEMEPIDGEVGGDQLGVNLDGARPPEQAGRAQPHGGSSERTPPTRYGVAAAGTADGTTTGKGARAPPACLDYTPGGPGCDTRPLICRRTAAGDSGAVTPDGRLGDRRPVA